MEGCRLLVVLALVASMGGAMHTVDDLEAVVPETSLFEEDEPDFKESMVTLRQMYAELQTKAKSGAEKTVGVQETVDNMIEMCTGKIEPAIKQAHSADQTTLNLNMQAVRTMNQAAVEVEKQLQQQANDVRDLIDQQQAAALAWKKAAKGFVESQQRFLQTYDDQKDTCCKKQHAAVLDIRVVPAYAECNYRKQETSGNCGEVAKQAVSDAVSVPWTTGLQLYRRLRSECTTLSEQLKTAETDTNRAFVGCGAKKEATVALRNEATQQESEVQRQWDAFTKKYDEDYTEKMGVYTRKETTVKEVDEPDRVREWGAVQQIKCMLRHYKTGGGFDDDALKECKTTINTTGIVDIGYPKKIPQLKHKLAAFEAQSSTVEHEHTCDKRTAAPEFTCPPKEPRALPECIPAAGPAPPTRAPTKNPTQEPTKNPTETPTKNPTQNPTPNPTPPPRGCTLVQASACCNWNYHTFDYDRTSTNFDRGQDGPMSCYNKCKRVSSSKYIMHGASFCTCNLPKDHNMDCHARTLAWPGGPNSSRRTWCADKSMMARGFTERQTYGIYKCHG